MTKRVTDDVLLALLRENARLSTAEIGRRLGLALAAELGWRGVNCLLVEQTDGRIHTPKMNEVNTRTMEFCRRWGIASQVMNCPFPEDHPLDVVFVTTLDGHEIARLPRPPRRTDSRA